LSESRCLEVHPQQSCCATTEKQPPNKSYFHDHLLVNVRVADAGWTSGIEELSSVSEKFLPFVAHSARLGDGVQDQFLCDEQEDMGSLGLQLFGEGATDCAGGRRSPRGISATLGERHYNWRLKSRP